MISPKIALIIYKWMVLSPHTFLLVLTGNTRGGANFYVPYESCEALPKKFLNFLKPFRNYI
jgi:hypothetical protein